MVLDGKISTIKLSMVNEPQLAAVLNLQITTLYIICCICTKAWVVLKDFYVIITYCDVWIGTRHKKIARVYLHFLPADGLVWELAAGSCRAGGCCWAAAGGGESASDSLCSRWVYAPRANHQEGFQISFPVGVEGQRRKEQHVNANCRTLWFNEVNNKNLWKTKVDMKVLERPKT